MRLPLLVSLLALSLPMLAGAEVYKCQQVGRTVYQDRACDKASQPAVLPGINTIAPHPGDDLAKRYDERLSREGEARSKADAAFLKDHAAKAERQAAVRKAILEHRAVEGMMPGEVESALGSADEKLPDGAWRYRRDQQRITVAFKDGVVSGVSVRSEKKKQ